MWERMRRVMRPLGGGGGLEGRSEVPCVMMGRIQGREKVCEAGLILSKTVFRVALQLSNGAGMPRSR